MKYKNIIFFAVLLINGFSSYAMNPSDYKLDGYGCTRCFGRTIHTLCHIALAACCKIYNEDITDPNGRVFLAAYNNDSDELAAALINGGNIDAGDLVSLAYYAPAKKLDLLLKHGANPDAKDSVGYTASENAIESGNAPALAVLLKYGARLDNIGASKLTLEQLAKKYGRTHCLEAIEDARQLRLAKRNEELEAYKAALQKQSWQKILKDYRAPSQPASCHEAPAPASSSIDLEKAQQQKNELRKKQELENEHARVTARQEEAYMREYTKGQRLARKKKVQLKQTKHKK